MSRRYTTHAELLQLTEWVEVNRERILKERPSHKLAAQWAARDLKMEHLPMNAIGTVFQHKGIIFPAKVSGHAGALNLLKQTIQEQKDYIDLMDQEIAKLRHLVVHLYQQLKVQPPAGHMIPVPANSVPKPSTISVANQLNDRGGGPVIPKWIHEEFTEFLGRYFKVVCYAHLGHQAATDRGRTNLAWWGSGDTDVCQCYKWDIAIGSIMESASQFVDRKVTKAWRRELESWLRHGIPGFIPPNLAVAAMYVKLSEELRWKYPLGYVKEEAAGAVPDAVESE